MIFEFFTTNLLFVGVKRFIGTFGLSKKDQ